LDTGLPLAPSASFNAWREKGRFVKKGENAISPFMPISVKRRADKNAPTDTAEAEEGGTPVMAATLSYWPSSDSGERGYRRSASSGHPGIQKHHRASARSQSNAHIAHRPHQLFVAAVAAAQSWQITPQSLVSALTEPDATKASRAMRGIGHAEDEQDRHRGDRQGAGRRLKTTRSVRQRTDFGRRLR